MPRIAVVQMPPVLLDKARTLAQAVSAVRKAAAGGADIVVFPEAFIPGYPVWIWRLRPGSDMGLTEQLYVSLLANAVTVNGGELGPLLQAAAEHKVHIVCGMNERDGDFSRSTLYNTVVVIGPDGTILNRHRKLMPTNPERMVWGMGDASGLKAVVTPHGRLGTMICWESYMPLARYALYAQGIEIYIAPTYDSGERWLATMQHIAREGGCWVVGCGCALQARDIPDSMPGKLDLYPNADEWINSGDSVVVAPGGKIAAGPMHDAYGILYADVQLDRVGIARRSLDAAGHYSRSDIFKLEVDRTPVAPIKLNDIGDAEAS
jgi:nitrilase